MNALKHGMTARLPVLPGEDLADFRRHVEGFVDALQPRTAVEVALAEQAALAVWKIGRAERSEAARVNAALRDAEAAADLPAQDEVAAMGHWLLTTALRARQDAGKSLFPFLSEDRHDPFERGRGDPRHIVLRLEATAAGCRWLLEQWDRLSRRLERGHDWRTNELITAVQLRGQRPMGLDVLNWEGLLEPVPDDGKPELVAQARRGLLIQFAEGLPADPAERRAALLGLVHEEAARLRQRQADHERRAAADRAELADRLAVDTTAEGERMRRYQLDFDRKLHRALNGLLKLRRAEDLDVAGDPAPGDDPAPDPAVGPVGTVGPAGGPADVPEGDVDAAVRPKMEGDRPEDEDPQAGGVPLSPVDPSSVPEPEPPTPVVAVATDEPASAGIAAPARRADEPEVHRVPPNGPTPPAGDDQVRQNEPSPPAGGDPISQDGPTGPGRIADRRVPALACALVILLAARLLAAFAGPVGGAGGQPGIPHDGRSSPTAVHVDSDWPGPFGCSDRGPGPEPCGRSIHAPPVGPRRPPFGHLLPGGDTGTACASAGGSRMETHVIFPVAGVT